MNTLKIEPTPRKQKQTTLSLPGALSAACLFAGIGGCFHTMFAADIAPTPPLIVGLTVISLSWLLRRVRLAPLFIACAAALCTATGFLRFELADGILSIVNRISAVIGAHMGENLVRYAASGAGETAAAALIAALAALGCVWLVRMRSIFIVSLIVLPIAALELLLGLASAPLMLALMFAGILLLHLPEMLLTRDSGAGIVSWLIMAAAAAGIFCGASFALDRIDVTAIAALRETLLSRIETARYGQTSLPGGDFSELDALDPASEPMLEITMSEPESLYLRGFIGSEYHSDGWRAAANVTLSDGADLFYWLHQDDFYGLTQLADAALLLDEELAEEDAVEIAVRHIGESRKYIYTPYELLWSEFLDPDAIGDVQLKSESLTGADSYLLISMPNQVKRSNSLISMLQEAEKGAISGELNTYLVSESHYNSFVYDHFLTISEETESMLAELLGAADFGGEPHLDYGEAKQRILEFFDSNISYRETVPPRIQGTDFLNEFLKINQSGYDVHYASAAVMMMRYFGIPARYVEGYLITPADAEAAEAGIPFVLSGERAHAWCEIYQDGIGWIPFEVTPKYMDLMERSDVFRAPDSSDDDETPPESEETPIEESSLDMNEDFHDDFEDEEEPENDPLPLGRLFHAAMGLIILLLLIVLIFSLSARLSVARMNRSFRLRDRKAAVANLYSYLFSLMAEIYGWHDCVAPSGFLETVKADMGADAAIKYEKAVEICEKAVFNTSSVLEDDYLFVYNFVRKTRTLLKKRSGFGKRLRLRYIRHLI